MNIYNSLPPSSYAGLAIVCLTAGTIYACRTWRPQPSPDQILYAKIIQSIKTNSYREAKEAPAASPLDLPPSPWRKQPLSLEQASRKMCKNAVKAIEEHRQKKDSPTTTYATVAEVISSISTTHAKKPLSFTYAAATRQGTRDSMDDAHFFKEMEQGICLGVFDGHGGERVGRGKKVDGGAAARHAAEAFEKRFFSVLQQTKGNVHEAFERLIHQIDTEIKANKQWETTGSTAVICYIDKRTHLIYTATLGDSEATIYRKFRNWKCRPTTKSIPQSCVRTWWSKKDMARLVKAHNVSEQFIRNSIDHPKELRSGVIRGLNLSRSMGDLQHSQLRGNPLVISKCTTGVNQAKPGDRLVLCCDGAIDFIPEQRMVELVDWYQTPDECAEGIAADAIGTSGRRRDNITVQVLDIV